MRKNFEVFNDLDTYISILAIWALAAGKTELEEIVLEGLHEEFRYN